MMKDLKQFALIGLVVALVSVGTWFAWQTVLDAQTQARKDKAAREMDELRQALVEHNEALKAKNVITATPEAGE